MTCRVLRFLRNASGKHKLCTSLITSAYKRWQTHRLKTQVKLEQITMASELFFWTFFNYQHNAQFIYSIIIIYITL